MTAYSEALEQQLALSRWCDSPAGRLVLLKNSSDHGVTLDLVKDAYSAIPWVLRKADPFYWESDICELIEQAGRDLPLTWSLHEDTLPAPYGFFWFAKPLALPLPESWPYPRVDLRGLLWGTTPNVPGRVLIVPLMPDPQRLSGVPGSIYNWGQGEDLSQHLADVPTAMVRAAGSVADHDGHLQLLAERRLVEVRHIATAFAFLHQRILVAPHQGIDRAARKRVARAQPELSDPTVRVVRLRRPERAARPDDAPGDPVEWSCRWIVRGHWRDQWFPKLQKNQPIWITPYVKGPDDKPLKTPRATVFAVVR